MNIDPVINSTMLVINGLMLACLLITLVVGRRKLRKQRSDSPAVMLFSEPRQCLLGFKQIHHSRDHHFHLPPLTKEDRL